MEIIKASIKDIDDILKLEELVFTPSYQYKDLEYELRDNPYSATLILKDKGSLIGFIIYWVTFDQAQIVQIAVYNEYRGLGYGQLLLDEMIKRVMSEGCETISLEVRVSNKVAIEFYQKNDFVEVAKRENYYSLPQEDGLLMIKGV